MLHGDRSFINRMLGKSEDLIISSAADTDTSVPDIQEKIQIAENIRPMSQAEIDTAVESTAGNTYEYNAPTSNKGLFIANNAIDMPSMPAADNTTNKSDESNEVLVEDNSKGLVSVHKFMEESYLNLDTGNIQEAKAGYTRALSTYHALSMADKRQTYIELYELYSRLKKI
jgi:hypothetical protein